MYSIDEIIKDQTPISKIEVLPYVISSKIRCKREIGPQNPQVAVL
jgi:hypothetical protein